MKSIAIGIVVSMLMGSAAIAQASYSSGDGNTCLKSYWIDHTRAPDDRTIIFYMKDNKAWLTHLKGLCPQLSSNGFVYVATPPAEVCGSLQAIRVIRSDAVCMIGPLEPYTPPAQHAGM
jgi:hypothetical protein